MKRGSAQAGLDVADNNQDEKPGSYGPPPVWSSDRTAMCEALPYYHSYQGSAYTKDGYVLGVLFDEDLSQGGHCDEEIIVSRITGGASMESDESNPSEGKISGAATAAAFLNNFNGSIPVAIIFGQKYQHCPSKLRYPYAVAEVFYITAIWSTWIGRDVVHRLRFQKQNLGRKSWWAVAGTPLPQQERNYSLRAPSQVCNGCGRRFPQIYTPKWMCLNHECSQFSAMTSLPPLNPAFLAERYNLSGKPNAPYSLQPSLPEDNPDVPFYSYTRARGIVCPRCKGCSSQVYWTHWECQTEGCGFTHTIPHKRVSHLVFIGRLEGEISGHPLPMDERFFHVTERSSVCAGNYRTTIFDLFPGNFVAHIQGNRFSHAMPRGPNEIFLGLQDAKGIPLQRGFVHGRDGAQHSTSYFGANYGMLYKFVAKGGSSSIAFADAPDAIKAALGLLTWAAKKVAPGGEFQKPNEMLVCGYMNENKMSFHSDGEYGLGETIVALTLGGEAVMNFRMKEKYYAPTALLKKEKSGKYDPSKSVPFGSKMYAERIALNGLAGNIDATEWEKQKSQLYDQYATLKGRSPRVLKVTLKHGDYLIMHGAGVQKYYEHEVIAKDALRFGLTARFIDPDLHNVPQEERYKGEFELGEEDIHDD